MLPLSRQATVTDSKLNFLALIIYWHAQMDGDESDLSSDDDAGSEDEDSEHEQLLLAASGAAPPASRKRGLGPQQI